MEIWKDIIGYEGLYQVSDFGNIKNKKGLILKPVCRKGYLSIGLYKNNIYKRFSIHRLVMLSFVGSSQLQVNHINGNKKDNRLCNLEYCTNSENIRHADKTGLRYLKGTNNSGAKLCDGDILNIIKLRKKGYNQNKIADIYNVERSLISMICANKLWTHIKRDIPQVNNSMKISKDEYCKIFELYKSGKYQKDIAKMYNVSQSSISSIIKKYTKQHP